MGKVFISYAREDSEKVRALAQALTRAGVSVWLDDQLVAGTHYDSAIEEALAQAEKVVVVWSSASVASRWVRAEAGDGLDRDILVPVVIETARIPLEFRRVQAVDLTAWQDNPGDEQFARLLSALDCAGTATHSHPAPDAARDTPSASGIRSIRAECLYSSKALSILRIRLWVGGESVSIRHTSYGLRPKVKVDGKTVSEGAPGVLHDYHRFPVKVGGGEHVAELTLSGGPITGMDGFTLRLDGNPVLSGHLSWKDHWFEAIVVLALGLILLIALDPLQYVLD